MKRGDWRKMNSFVILLLGSFSLFWSPFVTMDRVVEEEWELRKGLCGAS